MAQAPASEKNNFGEAMNARTLLLALASLTLSAAVFFTAVPQQFTQGIGDCNTQSTVTAKPSSLIWNVLRAHPRPVAGETLCAQTPHIIKVIPVDLYLIALVLGIMGLTYRRPS